MLVVCLFGEVDGHTLYLISQIKVLPELFKLTSRSLVLLVILFFGFAFQNYRFRTAPGVLE